MGAKVAVTVSAEETARDPEDGPVSVTAESEDHPVNRNPFAAVAVTAALLLASYQPEPATVPPPGDRISW